MTKNIFGFRRNKKNNFKKIYETNFEYVYSYVYSRLAGNKETTEDILQETFISAIKGYDKFKGRSSQRTWLCGIAKNKILNHYRDVIANEKFSYIDELNFKENIVLDVEKYVINNESKKIILDILNNLKPTYKYALILKYMDEYSVKEIAGILHKTPKAIDGILQRAKVNFKNEYIKVWGEK